MPYGYVDQDALVRSAKGNASWNPMSPDIDWGSWLGAMNQNLQSGQERKRLLQENEEDRAWNKQMKSMELQIRRDALSTKGGGKTPTKINPLLVTSLMKRLGYPEESIAGVESMDETDLGKTWDRLQEHFKAIDIAGRKLAGAKTTSKGLTQLNQLNKSITFVTGMGTMYKNILQTILSDPIKSLGQEGKINEYMDKLEMYQGIAGEIDAFANKIAEGGELTREELNKINSLLKAPRQTEARRFIQSLGPNAPTSNAPIAPPVAQPAIAPTAPLAQTNPTEVPPTRPGNVVGQTAKSRTTGRVWKWNGKNWE